MKKDNSIIIGSGVIGSYLAKFLLSKKQRIIVTSRKRRKSYTNYDKLNIENKVIFEELDVLKKNEILKLLKKYTPKNIFYFSGQSSLTKSIKLKKITNDSNYIGAKKILEILHKYELKTNFYKANSGYIFEPNNTIRDYSWAPEIAKGIYYLTKIKPRDLMLSSGQGISGYEILKTAYKQNNLDYRKYFSINKKFIRLNEIKIMMGSNKNYEILNKKFKYQIKTGGVKLVKKIFNSI